jgi:DNA-binding NarL/FixJ family response regulator
MSEKIKVLSCEDNTIFRKGIKAILSTKDDIEVIGEAENGVQLLHLLSFSKPDVILLDINMPVMNGEETLARLKEEYPDIKVIILTMNNDLSWVKKMIELKANSYLDKTSDVDEIYKAIKTCHEQGYYFSDLVNKVALKIFHKEEIEDKSKQHVIVNHNIPEKEIDVSYPSFEENKEEKTTWIVIRNIMIGIAIALFILMGIYSFLYIRSTLQTSIKTEQKYVP